MLSADIELCFKGDRTYLHGTDVYEAAVARLLEQWPGLAGRCRFTFHRLARRRLQSLMAPFRAGVPRPEGCVAEMHVTGEREQASMWFVEGDGDVCCRYPYDEDGITRDCLLTSGEIRVQRLPAAKPIEVLVAMTKRLHYAALQPAAGRWLFVGLDIARFLRPDDAAGLCVKLPRLPRLTLSRSEISVGEQPLGSIYFAVGAP